MTETILETEHKWLCRFCREDLEIAEVGGHLLNHHIEVFSHVIKEVSEGFMCLVCDAILEITEIGEHFLNNHLYYWKIVIRLDKK